MTDLRFAWQKCEKEAFTIILLCMPLILRFFSACMSVSPASPCPKTKEEDTWKGAKMSNSHAIEMKFVRMY